jgi:transcriptional regulator with XRE-family HTH domain
MDKELQEWYQLHQFHLYSGNYETKDLAEFLGVSERTIQRWLKEKTKPSKEQLNKINKYLKQKKGSKEAL